MHGRAYPAACALAIGLLAGAYANHFHGAFHLDDFHTIVNNLFIRDVANIPRLFVDPRTFSALPANQSYRPLVTATLAIDYRIGGGLRPEVLHATNFGLLVLQCVAMLVLFRRLLDMSRPHAWNRWVALFAAAWYGVHTANAETVNYFIARSDILSTFAVVLTVLMFTSRGLARTWRLYLIPAAAAVFAKEQGAMAAPLLFLYTGLFERQLSLRALLRPREMRAALRETWPAFVVCGAIVVAGIRLATTFAPGGSRWPYLFTQPFVLLRYAWTLFVPIGLSINLTTKRAFTRDAALRLDVHSDFEYIHESLLTWNRFGQRVVEVELPVKAERATGESRVVSSVTDYGLRATPVLIGAIRDYSPLKFFGSLALLAFVPSILIGIGVFVHWWRTGETAPYTSFITVSVGGVLLGVLLGAVAMLADLIARLKFQVEEVLHNSRRLRGRDS